MTAENFEGFGVEGFWKHRNLFGNAESLRAEASIGRIGQGGFGDLDYHADLLFKKPNAIGPATSFEARATLDVANTNAFNKRSGKISASLSNDLRDDLTVKGGIAAEYAVVDNGVTVSNTAALSAPISLTYDTRNNALNPTGGWFATLSTEPTYVHPSRATFVKTSVEASTYLALDGDERLVLAARAAWGPSSALTLPMYQRTGASSQAVAALFVDMAFKWQDHSPVAANPKVACHSLKPQPKLAIKSQTTLA